MRSSDAVPFFRSRTWLVVGLLAPLFVEGTAYVQARLVMTCVDHCYLDALVLK